MKRVLLIGEGPTAASALESLRQRFEVVGLARSADRRRHGDAPSATAWPIVSDTVAPGDRGGSARPRSGLRGRVLV